MFPKLAHTIVVEGPDQVGKYTQSQMLVSRIGKYCKVKFVEVPLDDKITYPLIYKMLDTGIAQKFPNLFQIVQFANKMLFQIFCLPLLLLKYDFVVFDRWALSGFVYGRVSGVNPMLNSLLYRLLIKPDATVVITGPSFSVDRVQDEYEKDKSFQRKVSNEYLVWAAVNEHVAHVANDGSDPEEIHRRIMLHLPLFFIKNF